MDDSDRERELAEARKRAAEAREAWRRAREEMREVFRRAREEHRRAESEGRAFREEIDDTLRDVIDSGREFARDVADETRRLADEVLRGARHEWRARWREHWEKSFGKDWRDHWVFGGRRFRTWTGGDEEANPFVAAILSRGGGLLAVYVLHLLAEQPRHGNDIMRQIERRTMGSWTSNPGAIYPLLSFMEEKGLVRSRWEDPDKRTRRIYHLTPEGRDELLHLRRILRPKVMEAIETLHVLYDDLYGADDEPSSAEGSAEKVSPTEPADPQSESGSTAGAVYTDADESGWRARLTDLMRRGLQGPSALGVS